MPHTPPPLSQAAIPRDKHNDYTLECAALRRDFISARTGAALTHTAKFSCDPAWLSGNIENFIGMAQVPVGIAGPLIVEGDHARGEFIVPLATTEGTLVASFNRGMRLLRESGGVRTAVLDQCMQRAPAFILPDARQARSFGIWVDAHIDDIRTVAEATTRFGRLVHIQQFAVGKLLHLRFNYTTGDAAGQNMAGKASFAACEWIKRNYPAPLNYILSGNMDTDKKFSHLNSLLTRGRRVVAEATIPADRMRAIMGIDTRDVFAMRGISATGAFLAGSANNGAHVANGLAALFIATGQDAADISESQAGVSYMELQPDNSLYWSMTLTSLIVGTVGGGTHLPTQRESLELLGCYGPGKAGKFAEICAATVLAGETSLAGAVLRGDWVSSHERLGRHKE